jgi:aspartate carbamoyltransferase catalytic subunit
MARSVVGIDDLSNAEIEAIFRLADEYLTENGTPGRPHRVRGRRSDAEQFILATIFFEPSTRTRLSFESAMLRLGGQIISSADPNSRSAVKGETIADTVRVVENYADLLVIRHPYEGAARAAQEYTSVPVINGGDGSHEHPTQTLCDLYTLRAGRQAQGTAAGIDALRDMNVVLWGDLRRGRTVHSLVYALARFGARVIPLAAPGCEFPDHVRQRLARDYNCHPLSRKDIDSLPEDALPADVLYVTPDEPHQLALMSNVWLQLSEEQQASIRSMKNVDAFYSTRLQRERLAAGQEAVDYPVIDAKFLKAEKYHQAQVLHPLPRVDELSYDIDQDQRGVYFKQASYGVPVRMALIAALLELRPSLLAPEATHRKQFPAYEHSDGIECDNDRCVTRQEAERRYLQPKFQVVEENPLVLRCAYCDHEQRLGHREGEAPAEPR